jgi:uncharacterized repeat protein (TIGR01451 family)
MKKHTFILASLIAPISLLLVFMYSGAALTPVRSSPALPGALDLGELPFSTWPEGRQSRINDSKLREYPDRANAYTAVTAIEWDDADSHKWTGEPWGDDIEVDWGEFDGRETLRARITSTGTNWALMRTDAFPAENWETKTGLRANIYLSGVVSGIDVKLEVRGPGFDPPDFIEAIYCNNLTTNTWNTCTWNFDTASNDYSAVSHLSVVFDHLNYTGPTFYVDDLRLVSATGEEEWDDMDDGSRWWFYSGNWYDWNTSTPFGLESISHDGNNPTTPAGSAYLQWDYENGVTTAEIGTNRLDDLSDWSDYNRISADVKVSDPDVPVSVFFWNSDAITTPVDYRGFGTAGKIVGVAGSWQTVTWDLPWPPWFDATSVDEIKFVVNDIDKHPTGTLYLDNIFLISDTLPPPVTGLEYIFENWDDRNEPFNDFSGNWGVFTSSYSYITITPESVCCTNTCGVSLKLDYDVPGGTFAGVWQSLWGHSDYTQTHYLDFTDIYGSLNGKDKDFEQIHFWVRGSGTTTGTHNVKVELKDNTNDFYHTAYRYITIDDGDTTWRRIVLDADVTNESFWSYNLHPPDPTKMKQLVFVVESAFNNPSGTFYIDDIRFVDANDRPFDLDQRTDDEFLDLVSERTFLYFLDWYDPDTGLFQDRSTFPDLMSTAATGFGLTALTIGESRGWISSVQAIDMVTRTLRTLRDGQTAADTITDTISRTNGYKGFFYHFLGENALRKDAGSELSPVDTAILVAGVLTVKEYFDVQEITDLADAIYNRIEWDWMLDPDNNWFYLAWKPECGPHYGTEAPEGGCFSNYYWDYYTDEAILINILAIGSPTHPVDEDVFYAWTRKWGTYGDHTLVHSWNGSFFTYVFAHLWVDFSVLGTDNHPSPTLQIDWWNNSVEAAWANWQFVVDHQDTTCDEDDDYYTTYGENSWGLTAADGPDGEYHAYGALPVSEVITPTHDGTIAPYGAGMAMMFLPDQVTPTLKHYFANTDLWRYRFGFGDAYNLDPPGCCGDWYNHAAFGIDQGPMLIAIENYRSDLIWETIAQNDDISRTLGLLFSRLTVGKQAVPDPVQAGSQLTYTIRVTNTGSVTLTATITDVLPTHIIPGETSSGTLILPGGTLAWTPIIIAPGGVWTHRFSVTVNWGYSGTLTNTVQATAEEGATSIYTETSQAIVTPELAITKQATPDPVQAGAQLTYTIYVTNTGNVTLNATVTDTLPIHITPGKTSSDTLILPGGTLTWTPTIPAPGGIWKQTVVVTVEAGYAGLLTNVVQVLAKEGAKGKATSTVCSRCCVYLPLLLRVSP